MGRGKFALPENTFVARSKINSYSYCVNMIHHIDNQTFANVIKIIAQKSTMQIKLTRNFFLIHHVGKKAKQT